MLCVTSKSAMTLSFKGCTATTLPGMRPIMLLAVAPTATTLSDLPGGQPLQDAA